MASHLLSSLNVYKAPSLGRGGGVIFKEEHLRFQDFTRASGSLTTAHSNVKSLYD